MLFLQTLVFIATLIQCQPPILNRQRDIFDTSIHSLIALIENGKPFSTAFDSKYLILDNYMQQGQQVVYDAISHSDESQVKILFQCSIIDANEDLDFQVIDTGVELVMLATETAVYYAVTKAVAENDDQEFSFDDVFSEMNGGVVDLMNDIQSFEENAEVELQSYRSTRRRWGPREPRPVHSYSRSQRLQWLPEYMMRDDKHGIDQELMGGFSPNIINEN